MVERVLRRVDGLGPAGRLDRGLAGLAGGVRRGPVAGRGGRVGDEAGRQREVVAVALAGQEVRDDGATDELVAEVDALVA